VIDKDDLPDEDVTVTPEDIEAAKRAWDAEGRQPFGTELFGRAVYGPDGKHGDVLLGDTSHLDDLVGTRVTAKRLGWDDDEDDEYFVDHTPYSEMGYDSPDLEGELAAFRFKLPDGSPGVAWHVGGQPADAKTIRPVS
jgi:hypothetical protein